jgi:DNA polymerase V
LQKLDPKHRPDPSPACETCPASLWFATEDQLKCFCARMHLIVWDGIEPPILKCDGRELAILLQEKER